MEDDAKRILIVEDDDVLLRASALALERAGYTVLTAAGGREGLAIAKAELPDLIVLDLLMPRPTGLEVLRILKTQEATRRIPVLVVSNSSLQRIVEEVEGYGDEYIVKANMSLRELAARVQQRLAKAAAPARGRAPQPATPTAGTPIPVTPIPEAPFPASVAPPAAVAEPIPLGPAPAEPSAVSTDEAPKPAESPLEDASMNCAGCGFGVGNRYGYCPRCGRKLAAPRSWGAMLRRVR